MFGTFGNVRECSAQIHGEVEQETRDKWLDELLASKDIPFVPARWTPEYIGVRLVDAFTTHNSLPNGGAPKAFGNAMPTYEFDHADRAGWALDDQYAVRVRRQKASAHEIARMEVAFGWAPRFLSHDAGMASCTQHWAMWNSLELDVAREASKCGWVRDTGQFDDMRNEGLRLIAMGLNYAKEPVA